MTRYEEIAARRAELHHAQRAAYLAWRNASAGSQRRRLEAYLIASKALADFHSDPEHLADYEYSPPPPTPTIPAEVHSGAPVTPTAERSLYEEFKQHIADNGGIG